MSTALSGYVHKAPGRIFHRWKIRQFRVNFERFHVNVTFGAVTPLQLPK